LANKPEKQSNASKSKLRTADKVVIILCFSGAIVSLGLFWADLFSTVRNKNATPLGTISFKYNTAQRRLADRVLWDRLRKTSPIYNGDTIRTADLSEATIRFNGGREMDLTENTIIRILVHDGSTEIDLSGGELNLGEGTGGDNIVLSMGDQKVEAGSDAVISAVAGKKGKAVQVASGKAVFTPAKGKGPSRTVTAGTSVSLGNNTNTTTGNTGNTNTAEPSVVVTKPLPNARFLVQGDTSIPVAFTWNRVNVASTEPLRMEIAQNRIFNLNKKTIPVSGSNATAEFPVGTWYWSIKQEKDNTLLASGRITVLNTPGPYLIAPVKGYTYKYRLKPPSVRFQWKAIDDAVQYQVDVANTSNFTNPKINIKVKGTSLDTSALTAGTWYWRVTPVFSSGYQGKAVSSSDSFKIEINNDLNAPTLVGPERGASVSVSTDKGVYFSWKKENEAASYTIQISKSQDMRNPIIKEKTKENVYVYRGKGSVLAAGNYYWTVSQTDIAGNESPASAVQTFSAVLGDSVRRPLFPPDNYVIAEGLLPDIRFTWKSDSNSNARFQVSKTSAFTAMVIDEKVLGDSFRGKTLPAGSYYWRVVGADAGQQANARQFTVASPLSAPAVQSPPPGGQVVLKGDADQMVLRWNPVNKAEQYIIRIFTEANRRAAKEPLHEQTVSATTLRLPANAFPNGAYSWTVQAFANETANSTRLAGLTGENRFSIRKLYMVTLDSPESNSEVKGTVVLRWSTPETIGNARLVISSTSNTSGAPVLEMVNPAKTITLANLKEGVYYWNIVAQTTDGFDISAAAPKRFRLVPNLLPEPAGRSPSADTVIGPEALRANQNIVFSCDPVEGADGYIFTVFKNTETGKRQQIIQTEPQAEPSWTLENLQSLGEGDFVWQVEAISKGTGKTKTTRGQIAENTFRMEVPPPNKVQILEAGIMYGN
jgi:hypothetical protein